MRTFVLAVIICLVLSPDIARSCEYCFISEHGYVFDMNRTLVRLDSRLQLFSGLTNSASLTDDVTTRYLTTNLTVNFASGRWGYTLSLPYVSRTQRNTYVGSPSLHYEHTGRVVSTVDSSSLETQSVAGLGDASAIVRYAVLAESGEKFASVFIQGGVKAATGSINARDAFGYLIHPHLQAGTGTTLALFGASGSYGGVKQSFDITVLAGVPVHVYGPYREPESFNYDATYRFRLYPEDAEDVPMMLIAHAGIIGKVSWKERYNGVYVPDSGGHYMFLSGGLSFIPLPGVNIELFAQLPLIMDLTGNQIYERFRLASGLQVAL
jgi:hypothetical protein